LLVDPMKNQPKALDAANEGPPREPMPTTRGTTLGNSASPARR
jgi:hypothetical protein